MNDTPKGDRQDPAEQYRSDRHAVTESQPEPTEKTVVEHVPTDEPHTLEVRETEKTVKEEKVVDGGTPSDE